MIISKNLLPLYGPIIIFSIIIGSIYIYQSLKTEKLNTENIKLYIIMYIVFSLLFGFMYDNIIYKKFGLSSYGGAIGVITAAIIFEMISPSNKLILKYTILSLPLVYGLSKISCFISGCCYGIPCNCIISVIYKDRIDTPLFPIQLIESIVFILLFLILNKYKSNKKIIYYTIVTSSTLKFVLDFFRYNHLNNLITINQILSIIFDIFVVIILIYKKYKDKKINFIQN